MSHFSKGSFHIAHFVLFVSGDKRDLDWYLEKIFVYQRKLLTPSFMSDIFPIVRNVDGVHREILKNARYSRVCERGEETTSVHAMECELVRLAGVPIGLVTSALFYSTDSGGSAGQEEPEVPHRR